MLISFSSCWGHSIHNSTYLNRRQRRLLDGARKNYGFIVLRLTVLRNHSPPEQSRPSDSYFEIQSSNKDPIRQKTILARNNEESPAKKEYSLQTTNPRSNRCARLGREGISQFPQPPPFVLSIKNDRFAFVNQCRVNTTAVQQPSRPMEDCIKWNMRWRQLTTLLARSVF